MNAQATKKYYRSLDPLLNAAKLAGEVNWDKIFGLSAPLELEIGFGNGEYLHRSSLATPEHNFIGIEIAWSSLKRALRRLAQPPRNNVKLLNIPAEEALRRLIPPSSLTAARSFFPVPWPKEHHEKKRLFSTTFLDLVASRLTNNGYFHVVTDNLNLAQWTLLQSKESALELTFTEKDASLDTKYERKWLNGGQKNFFHLVGQKTNHPDILKPGHTDMQAYYSSIFDPNKYSPPNLTGELTIKFGKLIYDQKLREGLLHTKVVESSFIQEFFIRITELDDGRWKFSAAIGGHLFPTEGTQKALDLAAKGALN